MVFHVKFFAVEEIKNLRKKIEEIQAENFRLVTEKTKFQNEEGMKKSNNQLVEQCKKEVSELQLKLTERGSYYH